MSGLRVRAAALTLALAGSLAVPMTSAGASGPTPARGLNYRCTVAATDLGPSIRVVYRLTSNGPHQRWHVRMWDQGRRFFVQQVTTGADGDFRVKGLAADRHGIDHLRVSARRLGVGPTCRVTITP